MDEHGKERLLFNPFPIPTVDEQVLSVEEDGRETLYICPDAWALRHRFVNKDTGEMIRARCDSWYCLYCGPRKVDQWRQLVRAADPTLFVTLSKVGWTVEQAARVLTTVVQRLRRGFKSSDPERKGFRESYQIEYFAVLERHNDFEENGFHWHLLVKGVEFLPKQVVSDALRSATKGRSYIVDVQRVRNTKAVGYVTKYLTKSIVHDEKGVTLRQREMRKVVQEPDTSKVDSRGQSYSYRLRLDEEGNPVFEKYLVEVEQVSKARRIRYSRRFFPEAVTSMRLQLFAGLDRPEEGEGEPSEPGSDEAKETQEPASEGSCWTLMEVEEFTNDRREYLARRRQALQEVLTDRRANGRRLSGRLLTVWDYQRRERSEVSWQKKQKVTV